MSQNSFSGIASPKALIRFFVHLFVVQLICLPATKFPWNWFISFLRLLYMKFGGPKWQSLIIENSGFALI